MLRTSGAMMLHNGRYAGVAFNTGRFFSQARVNRAVSSKLILGLLIGGSCICATTGSFVTADAPAGSSSFPAGRALDYTLTQPSELVRAPAGAAIHSYTYAAYNANDPMEDRFSVSFAADGSVALGVFDGHGGWRVSDYVSKRLTDDLMAAAEKTPLTSLGDSQVESLVSSRFSDLDEALADSYSAAFAAGEGALNHVGSCANVVVVTPKQIVTANAGDCRSVLGVVGGGEHHAEQTTPSSSSSSSLYSIYSSIISLVYPTSTDPAAAVAEGGGEIAVTLSNDHNAKIESEKALLRAAHPGELDAVVCKRPSSCYVKGRLQPTRSFGDFYLKRGDFNGPKGDRKRGRHIPQPYTPPYITAQPEMTLRGRSFADAFVVLGSDGLWDEMNNEQAVELVLDTLREGQPQNAARHLAQAALHNAAFEAGMSTKQLRSLPPGRARRGRHDDVTVVVAFLVPPEELKRRLEEEDKMKPIGGGRQTEL